jgi:hypothetical protein
LVVVVGEGTRVIPVDFTGRRPDPMGPGGPCRDKLRGLQVMLDRTWTALQRRRRQRPAPLVVADRWCGDSKRLTHVARYQGGTMLVEGKRPDVFQRPDGRQVTGREWLSRRDWPWRDSPQVPRLRAVRLTAPSPTSGQVTVVLVDDPSQGRDSRLCPATPITAPRLLRAWKRRSGMAHHCRRLTHLLATEACQVHGEDAYDGHLVLRLLAGMVLLYTARMVLKGQVTREEMVFSLTHHWRFLNSRTLDLHALSWEISLEAA